MHSRMSALPQKADFGGPRAPIKPTRPCVREYRVGFAAAASTAALMTSGLCASAATTAPATALAMSSWPPGA